MAALQQVPACLAAAASPTRPPAALGESAADSLAFDHPYPSMGHLTHMPGHLYIRLGRWHDAVTTNQAALRADEAGVKR
jgi:hypothetical protein